MKAKRLCILAAMLLLLTACSTSPQSTPEHSTAPENPAAPGTLPVLSIQTVSDAPDAIRFVTEPVDPYVSALVASWTPGYKRPPEPYYEPCTVSLSGTTLLNVSADVKVRGNWTTFYDKKPLRLKFEEKQSLLGLNDSAEQKNWVLLALYKDWSLLRDKAALQMSREILAPDGLYAADSALVEVQVNGAYWGVYLLAEQQQISGERISITKAEKDYPGTDIGYLLEYDGYAKNEEPLQAFAMDYAGNAPLKPFCGDAQTDAVIRPLNEGGTDQKENVGMTIKNDIYSQQQHDFIASYTNNVYRILYSAAYEDKAYAFNADYTAIAPADNMTPQQAVEAVVDTASLADMYIISEVCVDADLYWSSFYMDVDFGEGGDRRLRFEAPWDFDSALGNKDRCADSKGFYAATVLTDVNSIYDCVNPWLTVLMQEDWFREIIREKWTAAYDSGVFTRTAEMIRNDAAAYKDAFDRNAERWPGCRQDAGVRGELCRRSLKCKNEAEAAAYLAEWLENRVAFLNAYWHA